MRACMKRCTVWSNKKTLQVLDRIAACIFTLVWYFFLCCLYVLFDNVCLLVCSKDWLYLHFDILSRFCDSVIFACTIMHICIHIVRSASGDEKFRSCKCVIINTTISTTIHITSLYIWLLILLKVYICKIILIAISVERLIMLDCHVTILSQLQNIFVSINRTIEW